jgi:aminopeptidase N
MMAIGEFSIVKDKWEGLDVNYYVEPAYEKYAKAIFGRTPEMLTFFSKKLNYKYPWDKYSQVVIRDYVSGAMENTGAVTFMEAVQSDKRQLVDENWDNIIAHEMFHHWFGDLVTAESWSNLPLNESFANYAEYLWTEYKYGIDEADYHNQTETDQYFAEAESKQEPLIRYQYLDKEDMFDSHSYAKGGRILHMLRKYVGDEAFFKALNLYLNQHKYSDAEVHDLRLAFEEVTGEDLNWFFNQWFLSAGHPDLQVSHTYEAGKVLLTVEQKQDSLYTPIYKLPLKVDIWTNGKPSRHDIEVTSAKQSFSFPASAKPDLVLFDAETQLLGKVAHTKSKDELVFQYYNSTKYLARYQAYNELFQVVASEENAADSGEDNKRPQKAVILNNTILQKLAIDALSDKFWVIRQMAVRNFTDAGEKTALVEEKLKTMAIKDPRSYVRSEAINTLLSIQGKNYAELYKQALQDSSYTVVASALYAYLNTNPEDAAQQIKAVEAFPNTDITLVVANYFSETGDNARYDWFVQKLNSGSNQLLYTLVQLFGKYLMKLPPDLQKKGAQVLADTARKGSAEVRFATYQTLGMFKEQEGVAEIRQDIKQRETDSRVKELYDMVP